MKIYTKTGDSGKTSLLSGERVPKYNNRIEAYGTTDELNSFIGLLRSYNLKEEHKKVLIIIQNKLLNIGAQLATAKEVKFEVPNIFEKDISFLEKQIDTLEKSLSPLKNFIIPGGGIELSTCHVCRSICRRNERQIIKLAETDNVPTILIKYLNRLSDYLFVLSRQLTVDFNNKEIIWTK